MDHVEGRGSDLFAAVCAKDLEGIVAKWTRGRYHSDGPDEVLAENPQCRLFADAGAAGPVRRASHRRTVEEREGCARSRAPAAEPNGFTNAVGGPVGATPPAERGGNCPSPRDRRGHSASGYGHRVAGVCGPFDGEQPRVVAATDNVPQTVERVDTPCVFARAQLRCDVNARVRHMRIVVAPPEYEGALTSPQHTNGVVHGLRIRIPFELGPVG